MSHIPYLLINNEYGIAIALIASFGYLCLLYLSLHERNNKPEIETNETCVTLRQIDSLHFRRSTVCILTIKSVLWFS